LLSARILQKARKLKMEYMIEMMLNKRQGIGQMMTSTQVCHVE